MWNSNFIWTNPHARKQRHVIRNNISRQIQNQNIMWPLGTKYKIQMATVIMKGAHIQRLKIKTAETNRSRQIKKVHQAALFSTAQGSTAQSLPVSTKPGRKRGQIGANKAKSKGKVELLNIYMTATQRGKKEWRQEAAAKKAIQTNKQHKILPLSFVFL